MREKILLGLGVLVILLMDGWMDALSGILIRFIDRIGEERRGRGGMGWMGCLG